MNYQNDQNLMLLTISDTKRTLVHLFLFTNSAQRELVSICTQTVYATAINFPCIITLDRQMDKYSLIDDLYAGVCQLQN